MKTISLSGMSGIQIQSDVPVYVSSSLSSAPSDRNALGILGLILSCISIIGIILTIVYFHSTISDKLTEIIFRLKELSYKLDRLTEMSGK